jgi:hypothetical protein
VLKKILGQPNQSITTFTQTISQGTDAYVNSILVDTIGPGFHAYNWKRFYICNYEHGMDT